MSLVPVYLCFGDRAIRKSNGREALEFAPVAATEALRQDGKVVNAVTGRDRLDVLYLAYDLELHGFNLPRLYLCEQCTY